MEAITQMPTFEPFTASKGKGKGPSTDAIQRALGISQDTLTTSSTFTPLPLPSRKLSSRFDEDIATPSATWSSGSSSDSSDLPAPASIALPSAGFPFTAKKHDGHVDVLILGAGPTGLGAAHQMQESGNSSWLIVDALDRPGGMAVTERDFQGFLWDLGGHVIHSHFAAFDKAVALHKDWVHPNRGGWVRVKSQWSPTPIQQSLGNLKEGAQICQELTEIASNSPQMSTNLGEYYQNQFGDSLNQLFFAPFNRKQWASDLTTLDHSWTSLRSGSAATNVPKAAATLTCLDAPKDTSAFPYPRLGTGSLWQSIADALPSRNQIYSTKVVRIDVGAQKAYLSNGQVISYARCVSTIPLNHLLALVGGERPDLHQMGSTLQHSSTTAVGLGFEGELPEVLRGKSWIFSADPEVSFHRATILTNFSASLSSEDQANKPRWSVMFETSSSAERPVATDQESLVQDHLAELRRWGAISETQEPLSVWYKHLHMGYPLPFLGRDQLLSSSQASILPELERHGILSRGRFGGWRYESSNQDYAFVQGMEAVGVCLEGSSEHVYWPTRPDSVELPPIQWIRKVQDN